ncbi:hypothetical protein DN069_00880 [Streptacidiphilus pinicola]|uniref:ATP-binding protein n=1 Tax=Streptacidiphilus pinicola TaxID=2219663 RepID=A0A2X0IUX3_9ACTN|nr:hypothetical protein [Streptacidiphilus pinicola]RAG87423.1 hypothetical protein DN069_00880 [Streptacidiphilus pinicola]
MKKATLQAAGTAVLGLAAVTAVAGPAAADPLGGVPQVSSLTDSASSLTAPNGSLHEVTSTAQGLINSATPSVRSVQRDGGVPAVGGTLGNLPGGQQIQGGVGHALGALHGLPVQAPSIG